MSDMLSRLQSQASGFQAEAQRGQSMIDNFDLEKHMYSGADAAYRMGHEQLSMLVGAEVVQGLHSGLPTLYKTGKALAQRARGMAGSKGGGDPNPPPPDSGGTPPVQRTNRPDDPGARSDNVVNESLDQAPPSDRAERNLRYNPQEGKIETEGGAEARIGNERDIRTRTAPEQQEFDTPSFSGRNIPRQGRGPQPRQEYDDFGPRTFKAPTQAEHMAKFAAEREAALPHTAQPEQLPDLPGIGSGERLPVPAVPAESIGTRPVPGEVQPGPQSTYTRPSTAYRVNPQVTKSAKSSPAEEEGIEPEPVKFKKYRTRFEGADTEASRAGGITTGRSQRPNPGYRDTEPPADLGGTADADLRDRLSALRDPHTIHGDDGISYDFPNVPDHSPMPDLPDVPQHTPTTSTPDITARQGSAQSSALQSTEEQMSSMDSRMAALRSEPDTAPAPLRRGDSSGQEGVDKDEQIRQGDDYGLPGTSDIPPQAKELTGGGDGEEGGEGDEGDNLLKDIGEGESKVVGEEEVADAIPGVGDIVGGLIAVGAAISGIVEGSKASNDKAPLQPGGMPSMSTAFDSAPVLDSSDYHAL